jgi:hypothetical protein
MKIRPDVNDTLQNEGSAAVRDRLDRATKYNGPNGPNGAFEQTRESNRFKLVPFKDLRPDSRSAYLVKGIMPASGIALVWGPPKCGKSFWTFDLVMHVSLGWQYRGRRVNSGPVVYCPFEGADGFKARAEAFRRAHGIAQDTEVPFFLAAIQNAKLVRDHRALIDCIRKEIGSTVPVAVVLDTLNRSIDGSESKDEDMGAYLSAAEAIHQAFGCIVIIVHHCGIDGSRPRGHTSLTGTADVQIAVRRDAADNVVVLVEYMKDGPSGAEFMSKLNPIDVGVDQDGDPITSCVIVPIEGSAAATPPKSKKDREWDKSLLRRVLMSVLADVGADVRPYADGPTVRAVDQEAVRREFYKSYAAVEGDAAAKQNTRRKAFHRATEKAQKEDHINVRLMGNIIYVWPVKDPGPGGVLRKKAAAKDYDGRDLTQEASCADRTPPTFSAG